MFTQSNRDGQAVNNTSPRTEARTSGTSDKLSDKPWFELTKDIVIPLFVLLLGGVFTWSQFIITNKRQDADSADKAKETKEQVLTDYGKTIAELVTKDKLGQKSSDNSVKNIARGQTLIALRRLDPGDKLKNESGKLKRLLIKLNLLNPDEPKNDTGKLKGLLIRYLYDAGLIGYKPDLVSAEGDGKLIIDLYSANITNVVLKDAWLPGIGLQKAWLNEANFKNAYLMGASLYQVSLLYADFSGADLRGADLRGADLRFANLAKADISAAKLENACYVKGTEATYFPPDVKPEIFKTMVALDEDKSDPNKPNFERCPTVFLDPNP